MIRVYTSKDCFNKRELLLDNDAYFDVIPYKNYPKEFDEIIFKIDRARFLDKHLGTILTEYGSTNVSSLSSGCKTVLNVIYLYNCNKKYKAVCVNECGVNALEAIFDYVEMYNFDIAFVLEHNNKTALCKERDYVINDKVHITDLGFIGAYR